jgi:hypothetical protein
MPHWYVYFNDNFNVNIPKSSYIIMLNLTMWLRSSDLSDIRGVDKMLKTYPKPQNHISFNYF